MQKITKNTTNINLTDIPLTNIASELMRDQLLQVIRTAEMKQLKVIQNYINEKALCAILEYVKNKKTCETFDVIDNLDYEPKEICKILDFLEAIGKIKFE